MDNIIKTKRLTIRLSEDLEMQSLANAEIDAELKKAYAEMLSASMENPDKRQWYAAWFIETNGERIGDLCFKGLSEDGSVEIGYGLLPEYWGRGYATEAVRALVEWAACRPGVRTIEAETEEDNTASRRVLEKAGFVPTGKNGEEGPRFVWQGRV